MEKYVLLILFIAVGESKIEINVTASHLLHKIHIKHAGSDIKRVTDKEIQLFNITNDNLNRGVRVEMGKVPDEVFLKDPTVYGAVFAKYKWPDVRRKLTVRNIKIVEFIKQDVVLQRNKHINNATVSVTSTVTMTAAVTNTATAIWSEPGLPDDDIFLTFFFDFGYGKVLHKASWRNPNTTTFDMVIKKSNGVMEIQSGQSIISKLLGEKIILLVEIELDAHLVGNIVANYAHEYGKYHLWSPTIGNIMRAAQLNNEKTTKLLLEIRYYTNARLEILDEETGKLIAVKEQRAQKNRKQKFHFG